MLTDPVLFAKVVLKETPHDAQVKAMHGMVHVPHVAMACGRKWGKSLMLAWYLIWFCVTHGERKVFIVAPTMQQARIIFEKIVYYCTKIPVLKKLLAKKPVFTPFPRLEFANGTILQARGAANDIYLRGEEADLVVVDEAAYVRDSTITDVIEPMFTVTMSDPDAQIILISTPQGHNAFFDWFKRGQNTKQQDYRSFQFPTASNPYHDKKFLASQKQACGEHSIKWKTEYLAEFIDTAMSVFPMEDIRAAYEKWDGTETPPFSLSPEPGHKYMQGVDIAGPGKDYTVCAIFDYTDPKNIVLAHLDRFRRAGWETTYSIIRRNYERYNHCQTIIDTTGIGAPVLDELKDIGAQGYKIGTNESKHDLIERAVRAFAKHIIRIPPDQDIVNEFRYFQATLTKTGVVKMEAARGHDDIVIAICLALYPIVVNVSIGFFRPTRLGNNHAQEDAEEVERRTARRRSRSEARWLW